MEQQGLNFGQPVSFVCPIILSPQSGSLQEQVRSGPEPADEPRRRQATGAFGGTDRAFAFSTAAGGSAAMAAAKQRDSSPPRPPSPSRADTPPAAEEAPVRLDPLMVLCQAAQQQHFPGSEESEQQVPAGPDVHFGELSFPDTPPPDHYGLAADGFDELAVGQNLEVPMEIDEEQYELPSQEQQHEVSVQQQQQQQQQQQFQFNAAPSVMVPLRVRSMEIECELRPVVVTGSALLSAVSAGGQGALTVSLAPADGDAAQLAPEKTHLLYSDSQNLYAAPVAPADSSAVAQQVYAVPMPPVDDDVVMECESSDDQKRPKERDLADLSPSKNRRSIAFCDKDKRDGQPTDGRDSPSILFFCTQRGQRQLHLHCDGEDCCKPQDSGGDVNDSAAQLPEAEEASAPATVREAAASGSHPQNAEGESQSDKEAAATLATPESTADKDTAGGRDPRREDPVQRETTESTPEALPNSNATESETGGRTPATPDATQDTDVNLAKFDTVDEPMPLRSCTDGEVKNACANAPAGRRRKNPVRRHVVPATTPNRERKPRGRKRGADSKLDSGVTKQRRQPRGSKVVLRDEPVEQEKRADRDSLIDSGVTKQRRQPRGSAVASRDALVEQEKRPDRDGALQVTPAEPPADDPPHLKKDGGRRRGRPRSGNHRRCPAMSLLLSTTTDGSACEGPVAAGRNTKRKKCIRDSAGRRVTKASQHSCSEWMLQPLHNQPGQVAPLRLVVKRRTLTLSESSNLPSEYAVKEVIKSPLRIQAEDSEKSKSRLRRRRHRTNDCQSNHQESQKNNSLNVSHNTDQSDSKRHKPASCLAVNSEKNLSNDADDEENQIRSDDDGANDDDDDGGGDDDDDDDDDDEDWVPKNNFRGPLFRGCSILSKRINLPKRRKSVASGTDEMAQIPCTETVATMTSPEQCAEMNKEESLIRSTDTLPASEGPNTTKAKTTVTALMDASKSSAEHVCDTPPVSKASHTATKYNQPVVSQQHKVSSNIVENCQQPVPKKYKKAWQELWSAQQNDEQAKASLPEALHSSEELRHRDERCSTDLSRLSAEETPPSLSSNTVPPSSSSHMNEQETSENQCKEKRTNESKMSSVCTEPLQILSDDSVETLSDTTTDESDNESAPVTRHKLIVVIPNQDVPVDTPHHLQQPQGLLTEHLNMLNGRALSIFLTAVPDGPLNPALSQVPQEIIEHYTQNMKRSNHYGRFPFKYFSPCSLEIKKIFSQHKVEHSFYPTFTHIKQEPVDDIQLCKPSTIFAPSSGMFPYAGQPLGYGNMVIQIEGCCRKARYRRKGLIMENDKRGSQNNDITEIPDSDDNCPRNNSAGNNKLQGGNEKKGGHSNNIQPPSDLSLSVAWSKGHILYGYVATGRQRKKKAMLRKKCEEGYMKEEKCFSASQQGNSSLLQLTKEAYLWELVTQNAPTEAVAKDTRSYSQKHSEQMTQHECNIQVANSLHNSSSINCQSYIFPYNDSNRSVHYRKLPKKCVVCILQPDEKSKISKAKIEGILQQLCEVTKEKTVDIYLCNYQQKNQQLDTSKSKLARTAEASDVPMDHDSEHSKICNGQKLCDQNSENCQASDKVHKQQADGIHGSDMNNVHHDTCKESDDMVMIKVVIIKEEDKNDVTPKPHETSGKMTELNNCKHKNQQVEDSKSKLVATEEKVESNNSMSNYGLSEPESLHYSVEKVQSSDILVKSSVSVPSSNSETADLFMDHNKLVTEDDSGHSKTCDGQKMGDLALENCHAPDKVHKQQFCGIDGSDLNNVHHDTCEHSDDDIVMVKVVNIKVEEDKNDVTPKQHETSGKITELNNCKHKNQHVEYSESKLVATKETVESKNSMSSSGLPEPEFQHYSVEEGQSSNLLVNSSVFVPSGNSFREESETADLLMDHSKLVAEDDSEHSKTCNGHKMGDLALETCQAPDKVHKQQFCGINGSDLNNVHHDTCEHSDDDIVMIKVVNIKEEEDKNDLTPKQHETSGKITELNNCKHKNQQVEYSESKLVATKEKVDSKNSMSSSGLPEPESLHYSVEEGQSCNLLMKSSVFVPSSNSETADLLIDHSKLVTEDDSEHSKTCDGHKMGDLALETCHTPDKVHKQQSGAIDGSDLNNAHHNTCEESDDIVTIKVVNIEEEDKNDVTPKPHETSGNIDLKLADCTRGIDLEGVAQEICEASSDIVVTQTDKTHGATLNDVAVKESLITGQSRSNENSKSNADVEHPKEESMMELCGNENQQQHFNMSEQPSEDGNVELSQPKKKKNRKNKKKKKLTDTKIKIWPFLMEANELKCTDVNKRTECNFENSKGLSSEADCQSSQHEYVTASSTEGSCNNEQQSVNLKNDSSVHTEEDTVKTVDRTCEDSKSHSTAGLSSANLIQQLAQSQQNSRVFDPLVSWIKARPIVGDSALRFEMMVKKELANFHKKDAKQKKKSKKKIGSIGNSKTKKKKLFSGKGFCGFRDNDKDMDGCGPGKGGFGGGVLTLTVIVSSISNKFIFPLCYSFLTKGINICKRCRAVFKQPKSLSHTFHITCWLLYFGFQHVCPFSI